ncbi:hypothetical protein JXB12_05840, partial [candidate division KSB1 bacterium]|nr:hypothetical protein [candidate division KSB1 bacterium]
MRIKTIVTVFLFVLFVSSMSMAQSYQARESFDYPIGTSIDTLMGTASNGWAGAWYKNMIYQENAALVSTEGLNYDDLSYEVPHTGNHLETVPDSLGTEQRYSRKLDKDWPNEAGKKYWISVVMNVKNATDNATWLGVKYYLGDTGEICMFGKGHGLDKYTCGSGWHGGEGPEVSSVAWADGPVWLVGLSSMQGAESTDYDTTYMWINPDPLAGEPQLSMADAVALTSMKSGFNTIRIEFGGSVGEGLSASFDELRLGTSWADVSSEIFLARESFEYPISTPIDTLMGMTSNGWAGAWYKNMIYQENAAVVSSEGLVYDDLSYEVPHVGYHLETIPDPLGTEQRYSRMLEKDWLNEVGRNYWISLVMNVKNATDNATWLGVKYYLG